MRPLAQHRLRDRPQTSSPAEGVEHRNKTESEKQPRTNSPKAETAPSTSVTRGVTEPTTLKALLRQTSATEVAADAAKKGAEVAEMALRLAERAEVLLDASVLDFGKLLNGTECRVILQFKNFGRTRAKEVKVTLHLAIEGIPPTDCGAIPSITMGA